MANMPEHLHVQAKNAALRNTFQEPLTGIAESLQTMVDKANIPIPGTGLEIPLGRIVMPFVKTPANHRALRLSQFGRWRRRCPPPASSRNWRPAAPPATWRWREWGWARRCRLIAAALHGRRHADRRGPSDPQMNRAWRDAGNQPYSIRVGDTWYGYNKVDPLGMHLGRWPTRSRP
jgi:hypothetical protein